MEYAFVYIVLGLLVLSIVYLRKRKELKGTVLPGPKGLPIIGCIHEINDENIHLKLMDYAEKYGDIFQVKMLFDKFVVLNSENIIRKCFGGDLYKQYFSDRQEMFYGEHFACKSQALSFVVDGSGQFHKTARKLVIRALHAYGSGLQELENNVHTEMTSFVQRIEKAPGQKFECVSMFLQSLSSVLSLVLTGETLSNDEQEINMFKEEMEVEDFYLNSYVNFIMSTFPFLRYLPGKYGNEYRKAKSVNAKIVRKFFHDVKKTYIRGQVRGVVDFFLEEQAEHLESNDDVFPTDETIIAQVVDLVDAGITTTWSTLSNTMLILLNYPKYQEKLQEEFDREIGQDKLPTYKDRGNCTFFQAFEMEVHRYISIVPLLLPHKCRERVRFEGYDIDGGSTVIGNAWFIHHNKDIWGDPWTFRPERFLDEHGYLLPVEHALRKNLMPFGYGLRQCPGEKFAKTRYFLFVSTLVQRWNFEFPADTHVSCDPRLRENFDISVVIRPKQFFCCAKKRM